MKILNFFLFFGVIFALLDPIPDSESGSIDLIESGSNTDPDPKHWKIQFTYEEFMDQSINLLQSVRKNAISPPFCSTEADAALPPTHVIGLRVAPPHPPSPLSLDG